MPSLDDSVRVAGSGASVVLVGAAGVVSELDLTFVWTKELKIEGTVFYAQESFRGRKARTFEATLELLTSTRAPLASLVTHRFALEDYARAIEANVDRERYRSVKAVFGIGAK
jgi:threonine dehydrogenase-like Zn-dependent dehydrogenase